MFVYRIEHPDSGKGPYTHQYDCAPYNRVRNALDYTQISNNHPGMWKDLKPVNGFCREEHYCAFESFTMLCAWFTRDALQVIHDAGFICNIYSVDEHSVSRGKYQVGLLKCNAALVDSIAIDDLLIMYA